MPSKRELIITKTVFTDDEINFINRATVDILQSGWLVLGKYTKRFEHEWCIRQDCKYAISTSSGTAALEIIFRSLDVIGKDVLIPSNTNFATPAAAVYAGANVVLYDSGLYFDLEDIKNRTTKDTTIIVVVHIGGYISSEIFDLKEFCNNNGIVLIEDAAHAHGASLNGTKAGNFGKAAAFSFFPTKVMTTGEGGIIITDDESIFTKSVILRNQGKDFGEEIHHLMGNSWRMTEIEASIGLTQLENLEDNVKHREKIIKFYREALDKTPLLEVLNISENMKPSGYKCIALLPSLKMRRSFIDNLKKKFSIKIARGVYEMPIHRQPLFKKYSVGQIFPLADSFADRHVCLPLWRNMKLKDAKYVVDSIKKVLNI